MPSKKAKAPIFKSSFGITHPEVHKMMKDIYENQDKFSYIDSNSEVLLRQARDSYSQLCLTGSKVQKYHPIFEGTAVQNTVGVALKNLNIDFNISECFIEINYKDESWKKRLIEYLETISSPEILISNQPRTFKEIEKFDRFLPDKLLDKGYCETLIDLEGSKIWVKRLIK